MGTGLNTDLQSILNSAMNQLSSLGVFDGSDGSSTGVSSSNYVNSVWGLVQSGEDAINGNDQQKAQAISNIVQNLMSMLMSLGTNENSKATQEVNNNDKKANELSQKSDKTAADTQAEINTIVNDLATNSKNIFDAIKKIEELGGNQDDIEKAQKAVLDQAEIIKKNLRIINDGASNIDAKQEALKNVKVASGEITKITSNMSILTEKTQRQIQEQNSIVEASTENISGLIEKSVETISNGTANLQSYIQQGAQQTVVNTTTSTTGAADKAVGATATSMGSKTSAIPVFGQTASLKFLQIGADRTAAGGTRIGGSTKTLASLTQAIGKMGSSIQGITGFVGNVEGAGNSAIELVGCYQTKLNSIITATGSWSQVADANADLQAALDKYEGKGKNDNIWNKNNYLQTSDNQPSQGTGTIDFDVNRFKTAFGI